MHFLDKIFVVLIGVPDLKKKMPESNTTGYPAYTLCNFHPISHLSTISAPENTGLLPTNTPVSVSIRFILPALFNILRPRQNGCHFADGIFKCKFYSQKKYEFWLYFHKSFFLFVFKYVLFIGSVWISIEMSFTFVPESPIDKKSVLVQEVTWHQTGNKP